jgi:hypothetical protein
LTTCLSLEINESIRCQLRNNSRPRKGSVLVTCLSVVSLLMILASALGITIEKRLTPRISLLDTPSLGGEPTEKLVNELRYCHQKENGIAEIFLLEILSQVL